MSDFSVSDLKSIREATGAGVSDIRTALIESKGSVEKAKEILKEKGLSKADKKSERNTSQGIVETYKHLNGKVSVVVEVLCETDFVARTEDFLELAREVAMQVAAMNPKDKNDLMSQAYIRDSSMTIEQLVKGKIAKLGENIQIGKFARIALGE
jgi:elongation factor Ts